MKIIQSDNMRMNYRESNEFKKDFKKLSKKYKSLDNDLELFKKVLNKFPQGNSKHFTVLTESDICIIIKARFFCKYLKKNSFRIIYSYFEKKKEFEFVGIEFIELYFKGNKEREDDKRIEDYLKGI